MTSTDINIIYRNAIALNNLAIHLLEKHCYRQAQETFQDAILLMKHAKSHIPLRRSHQQECYQKYNSALKVATQVLNAKTNIKNLLMIQTILTSTINHFSVFQRIISDSCVSNIYPILIDDIDCSTTIDCDNDYECAIMLYNYSLVSVAFSHCQVTRASIPMRSHNLKSAIQLLQMSHCTFSNMMLRDNDHDSIMETTSCSPELLIFEALIVNNLIKLMKYTLLCYQNIENQENLQLYSAHLEEIIVDIEETNPVLFGDNGNTAAAAA